jgi:hypothetical protein
MFIKIMFMAVQNKLTSRGGAKRDGAGFHTCKVSSSLSKVAASILERRNQICAWNMGMRKG